MQGEIVQASWGCTARTCRDALPNAVVRLVLVRADTTVGCRRVLSSVVSMAARHYYCYRYLLTYVRACLQRRWLSTVVTSLLCGRWFDEEVLIIVVKAETLASVGCTVSIVADDDAVYAPVKTNYLQPLKDSSSSSLGNTRNACWLACRSAEKAVRECTQLAYLAKYSNGNSTSCDNCATVCGVAQSGGQNGCSTYYML